MKFNKALKMARKIARDSGYCTTICRISQDQELGFEVNGVTLTPINVTDGKPMRKRSFSIKDLLADDWVVINAYGEEC